MERQRTQKSTPKFPLTRLQKANYSSVVPDKANYHSNVKKLKELLQRRADEREFQGVEDALPVSLPPPQRLLHSSKPISEAAAGELTWSARLKALKKRLNEELLVAQRNLHLQEQQLRWTLPDVQCLLASAVDCPTQTAEVLCSRHAPPQSNRVVVSYGRLHVVCGGTECQRPALPFSKFCLLHINLDSEQVLYRKCLASTGGKVSSTSTSSSFTTSSSSSSSSSSLPPSLPPSLPTSLRCARPVLDLLSDEPYCGKHVGCVVQTTDKPQGSKKKVSVKSKAPPSSSSSSSSAALNSASNSTTITTSSSQQSSKTKSRSSSSSVHANKAAAKSQLAKATALLNRVAQHQHKMKQQQHQQQQQYQGQLELKGLHLQLPAQLHGTTIAPGGVGCSAAGGVGPVLVLQAKPASAVGKEGKSKGGGGGKGQLPLMRFSSASSWTDSEEDEGQGGGGEGGGEEEGPPPAKKPRVTKGGNDDIMVGGSTNNPPPPPPSLLIPRAALPVVSLLPPEPQLGKIMDESSSSGEEL